jgi:26S proteasome regulatory subunit N5
MSAGLLKPEKDFTKDADKLIPEAEALAKVRMTAQYLYRRY